MDKKTALRRKKKKPRYDFLNKKFIEESDDSDEMDWDEVLEFDFDFDFDEED